MLAWSVFSLAFYILKDLVLCFKNQISLRWKFVARIYDITIRAVCPTAFRTVLNKEGDKFCSENCKEINKNKMVENLWFTAGILNLFYIRDLLVFCKVIRSHLSKFCRPRFSFSIQIKGKGLFFGDRLFRKFVFSPTLQTIVPIK